MIVRKYSKHLGLGMARIFEVCDDDEFWGKKAPNLIMKKKREKKKATNLSAEEPVRGREGAFGLRGDAGDLCSLSWYEAILFFGGLCVLPMNDPSRFPLWNRRTRARVKKTTNCEQWNQAIRVVHMPSDS